MINSRKIQDLDDDTSEKCQAFLAAIEDAGLAVVITSTYRDIESQNALYAQGRTKSGKKVTNAKGGYSFHNFHCAFDFVPSVDGEAQWDDEDLFAQCGAIGEEVGLEWGGNFTSFCDRPHLQNTQGKSLAEWRAEG